MLRKSLAVSILALVLAIPALAIEKVSPDPRGTELCTKFLEALLIPDPDARLKAVLPLLHASMKTSDGKDLEPNVKGFSYKKACSGAQFYQVPAVITEVHKGRDTTIGFGPTAQAGRTDKYFVAKKDGVAGRPAPLHVFFPADGGAPTLVNIGSL